LQLLIPVASITNVAAQTAPTVTVSLMGTYGGGNINISNAGTLTNVQPTAFTTTLSASYSDTSLPFYATTSTIIYSYSNSVAITSFGGTITPSGSFARNATSPSGNFASVPILGATIGGNAIGNGLNGAGSATVTLTGSIGAIPTFIPAFWVQTATFAPPVFSSASNQTTSDAQGSSIAYPAAPNSSYNWVCTQRPLANLMLASPFGNAPLVPDVTAPTQTISGQVFNVYGWTKLSPNTGSTLIIS
jgi:hypothetical protein